MADPKLGLGAFLAIAREHIEGVAETTPEMYFDLSAEACKSETSLLESAALGAAISGAMSRQKQAVPAIPVKEDNKVDWTCEPRLYHLPYLLGLTFGGTCGGVSYSPKSVTNSFTVWVCKVAELEAGKTCERYAGCKIKKLTLSSEANGTLKAKIEGPARTCTVVSAPTPDYSAWNTKPPMIHSGLTLTVGPAEIPTTQIYSIEVELDTGVEEDHFANSLTRICAPNGVFTANGKVSVPWNDDTAPIRTKIKQATLFALTIRWSAGTDTFDLALSCKATGDLPTISGPEGQKLEVSFECFQSGATDAAAATLGS